MVRGLTVPAATRLDVTAPARVPRGSTGQSRVVLCAIMLERLGVRVCVFKTLHNGWGPVFSGLTSTPLDLILLCWCAHL